MTLQEMGRYLLEQNQDVESSAEETPAAEEAEDILPDVTLSENIEDRRDEPIYGPGVMRQIWGELPHDVAPQAQVFGPNPLANALGFSDVGKRPAPAPQVLGQLHRHHSCNSSKVSGGIKWFCDLPTNPTGEQTKAETILSDFP